MNKLKLIILLFMVFLLSSCSRKSTMETLLDFNAEDVSSVTIAVNTEEEKDTLDERSTEGVQDFMDLLTKVMIKKELDHVPVEAASYYHYTFNLSDGSKVQFLDYEDSIQIIDKEGNETWYDISANTWGGLNDIWAKYYIYPNFYRYNQTGIVQPANVSNINDVLLKKPVIYLYPEKPTEISIKLDINGKLTYTYPEYNNGWKVLAYPDGTLQNITDGKIYSYLFWEGLANNEFDMSKGFVVKGSDTTEFLEEKLSYLGLTNEEYNDFIVYWAPQMSENPYNLITFQQDNYTDKAKLTIIPEPDSILRVFMVYQPLKEYINIPEQELTQWYREGFSIVEWGGAEIE